MAVSLWGAEGERLSVEGGAGWSGAEEMDAIGQLDDCNLDIICRYDFGEFNGGSTIT